MCSSKTISCLIKLPVYPVLNVYKYSYMIKCVCILKCILMNSFARLRKICKCFHANTAYWRNKILKITTQNILIWDLISIFAHLRNWNYTNNFISLHRNFFLSGARLFIFPVCREFLIIHHRELFPLFANVFRSMSILSFNSCVMSYTKINAELMHLQRKV